MQIRKVKLHSLYIPHDFTCKLSLKNKEGCVRLIVARSEKATGFRDQAMTVVIKLTLEYYRMRQFMENYSVVRSYHQFYAYTHIFRCYKRYDSVLGLLINILLVYL